MRGGGNVGMQDPGFYMHGYGYLCNRHMTCILNAGDIGRIPYLNCVVFDADLNAIEF